MRSICKYSISQRDSQVDRCRDTSSYGIGSPSPRWGIEGSLSIALNREAQESATPLAENPSVVLHCRSRWKSRRCGQDRGGDTTCKPYEL